MRKAEKVSILRRDNANDACGQGEMGNDGWNGEKMQKKSLNQEKISTAQGRSAEVERVDI